MVGVGGNSATSYIPLIASSAGNGGEAQRGWLDESRAMLCAVRLPLVDTPPRRGILNAEMLNQYRHLLGFDNVNHGVFLATSYVVTPKADNEIKWHLFLLLLCALQIFFWCRWDRGIAVPCSQELHGEVSKGLVLFQLMAGLFSVGPVEVQGMGDFI